MTARFVTADAIDFKLHVHVPLGYPYLGTKSRLSIILGLATRGLYVKTEKVL